MIQFLLLLFRPFRSLIEKNGADYEQFIRILELKLTLDNRKQGHKKSSTERSLIIQSISQIAMGFIFCIISIQISNEFTFYYLMHTIIMVMVVMMIISEFTTILFDTSENNIIQPLPVKSATLSLARNSHIFLYLFLIAFNMSLATLVVGIFKFGILSGLLFMITIIMNVLFSLFLSNILYLGLMRFSSGERLKNILMYFQIIIAILFMGGYQIGINLIDRSNISNMVLPVDWYTYLIPPAMFSGFINMLSSASFTLGNWLLTTEAILLPIIVIFITYRFLTPVFNSRLLHLESGDRATKVKSNTGKTTLYYRIMERLYTRTAAEKASFQLAWRMSGYERLFKQSFFPSLAYVLILVIVQFLKNGINIETPMSSGRLLVVLYSFMLASITLTNSLTLGNNGNIGWIFRIMPVDSPADYFKGFIKAVFVRFFNPFYAALAIGIIVLQGISAIPDILIAWLGIYLITLVFFYAEHPGFPFSQPKLASQGGIGVVRVILVLIIAIVLGIVHFWLIRWKVYGSMVLFLFYLSSIFVCNRFGAYKLINWNKIE